jgi:hypothetical protein
MRNFTVTDSEKIGLVLRLLHTLVQSALADADRLREMDARLPEIIATGDQQAILAAVREKAVALRELRATEAAVRATAASAYAGTKVEGCPGTGIDWLTSSAPASA